MKSIRPTRPHKAFADEDNSPYTLSQWIQHAATLRGRIATLNMPRKDVARALGMSLPYLSMMLHPERSRRRPSATFVVCILRIVKLETLEPGETNVQQQATRQGPHPAASQHGRAGHPGAADAIAVG